MVNRNATNEVRYAVGIFLLLTVVAVTWIIRGYAHEDFKICVSKGHEPKQCVRTWP